MTLGYDPGLRLYQVAGAATTRFLYDGVDAIAEYDGANALQRRFVFDPTTRQPVVWYEGTGTASTNRRYLSLDERGSVISVSGSTGASLGLNTYDEYGKPGASNLGRYQYTGQKWIGEANVYDYKARDYVAHLGIFAQTDPIGQQDSPNLYAYVLDDPVNWVDPLGLTVDLSNEPPIVIIGCQNGGKYNYGTKTCSGPIGGIGPAAAAAGSGEGGGDGKDKKDEFTCATALQQPGKIRATGVTGGVALGLGWTAGKGTWTNLSTGAHGSFITFGFAAGFSGGAARTTQTWSSLAAFAGTSDSYTVALSMFGLGPVSAGGEFSKGWNDVGSGGAKGLTLGPNISVRVTAQTAWTDTQISNCKPGTK